MKRHVHVEEDILQECYNIISEQATHDLKFGNFKEYNRKNILLNKLIKLLAEE